MPVDLQLKLFDYLVSPILLYASELWGFENKESIEKYIYNFVRTFLKYGVLHLTIWYTVS